MSGRLACRLPTQLWQLSVSFLPIPFLVQHVPKLNRFFNEEIMWNAQTSGALMWRESQQMSRYDCVRVRRSPSGVKFSFLTPLMKVCSSHIPCPPTHLKILLSACTDDDVRLGCKDYGFTALHYACCHDVERVTSVLARDPTLVHVADNYGQTALTIAAAYGGCFSDYADIVHTLLDANADVNQCDLKGSTALKHACMASRRESVSILLSAGAHTQGLEFLSSQSRCGQLVHEHRRRSEEINR